MRKTKSVLIQDPGGRDANRDHGKRFLLTEMPAAQAEKWAMRAFFALGRAGYEVPAEIQAMGLAGLAILGVNLAQRMHWEDLEPLVDEMWGCVAYEYDPGLTRAPIDEDTEEVRTRLFLRSEVLELHLGFSVADVLSRLYNSEKTAAEEANASNTPTSQDQSAS